MRKLISILIVAVFVLCVPIATAFEDGGEVDCCLRDCS